MPDSHKNFAYSLVGTAPSPASSGTSLVVGGGDGTKFPTVPFNATVWPAGSQPTTANAEIVRVTNIATDTFTITRAQEGTAARTIVVGDQIAATITAKTLTDAEYYTTLSKSDTGNQNNYAPGLSGHTLIVWSGASDATFTGFAGGVTGQIIRFVSASNSVAYFTHQSGSSSVGNKLRNYVSSGLTPVAASGSAAWQYDGTDWRLIQHDQGAGIVPTFSAGNYTSTGTWTVGSGDVTTQEYVLRGRLLTVIWYIQTTTVAGTPSQLLIGNGAYGSYTSTRAALNVSAGINSGGAIEACIAQVGAGGTSIGISQVDGGTWSNATDTTTVYGQLTFEVN